MFASPAMWRTLVVRAAGSCPQELLDYLAHGAEIYGSEGLSPWTPLPIDRSTLAVLLSHFDYRIRELAIRHLVPKTVRLLR